MSDYGDLSHIARDEVLLTCPYFKNHSVLKRKFVKHLRGCEKSYTGNDLKKCRYDQTHVIPVTEYEDHLAICSGRLFFEKQLEEIPSLKRKAINEEEIEEQKSTEEDYEDWEDEDVPSASNTLSMEDRKKRCLESDMIVHHQHKTKSEMKADREERHRRIEAERQLKEEHDHLSDVSSNEEL